MEEDGAGGGGGNGAGGAWLVLAGMEGAGVLAANEKLVKEPALAFMDLR